MIWSDIVVQGVALGGVYALFAAGLSLAFAVTRLVNVAQGDLTVLAAYAILTLVSWLGLDPFLAAALVAPLVFGTGWILQGLVLERVSRDDAALPVLVTFALAVVIHAALGDALADGVRRLPQGLLDGLAVGVGPADLPALPLLSIAAALVMVLALRWRLARSRSGRAFRAVSDDQAGAALMGLRGGRVRARAMAVALLVAGTGGLLAAMLAGFGPATGPAWLIFGFEAAIIGGLGSLRGALAGGLVLGLAQSAGAAAGAESQALAGHAAFLLMLVLRPRGLFPRGGG